MGIGPEVALRALVADGHTDALLIGRAAAVHSQAAVLDLDLLEVPAIDACPEGALCLLPIPDGAEPAEVASIRLAAQACLADATRTLVTGPIHKGRLAARGFRFKGHTDFLGHLAGAPAVMAFAGAGVMLALVTDHLPLSAVSGALSKPRICRVTTVAAQALRQQLGVEAPRIRVCGLNPHAGEGGVLGREEIDTIGPACDLLRDAGLSVVGPVSAEQAFTEVARGEVDLVVAMYHDQGLVPLKVMAFGQTVNWTLGLPLRRVSVDHGTADDLVGTGRASIAGMRSALSFARRLRRGP